MIPTLLLIGLVLGAFVRDQRTAKIASAVVVVFAILWGAVIGIAEADPSTGAGAAAIGLANLAFAALLAAGGRRLLHQFKPPGVTPL